MNNRINYKLVNLVLVSIIIYFFFNTSLVWSKIVEKIITILTPFFISLILVYFLNPFVKRLESLKLKRNISIVVVSSIFIILIFLIIFLTIPILYKELISLSGSIVNFLKNISIKFDINTEIFESTLTNIINDLIKNLSKFISNGSITLATNILGYVTKTIIIFIISIYLLVDMEKIKLRIKELLQRNNKFYHYIKKINDEISKYFHTISIIMMIQFIEYSILFRIVNHPNWFLLGVLSGITVIVPYIGGLIVTVVAVITSISIGGYTSIGTIVVTLIFPIIDGYLISPKIYGKANNIKSLYILMSVLINGALFGTFGVVLAVPILIIIVTTYSFYKDLIIRDIKKSENSIIN